MKFFIVESFPLTSLIPLGSKYSPQDSFSNTLSLHSSLGVIGGVIGELLFASGSCFQIPLACIPPLIRGIGLIRLRIGTGEPV